MATASTAVKAHETLLDRPPSDPRAVTSEPDAVDVRISRQKLARIAGGLYLTLAVCSFFGIWVSSRIIESDDAAATADNIRTSTTLFRAGLMVELLGATAFLLTAMALYVLLAHVDRLAAAAMVTIVAVSTAIMSLNLINQYAALKIATTESFTRTFGAAQSDQLTLLFTDLKDSGFFIAQMTFGLWLLPLGYLVVKSGYFPKALGILLMIACLGYLVELSVHFLDLADSVTVITGPIEGIPEVAFVAWLLVKGVRTPSRGVPTSD
jgi:hypothetical protein